MHTAERLRIILNSREDASLANIICSYISHQSSPLLINIIFHQLQPVGNAAESKHCHWLLDYEHLLLPFCSWISNEIQWREKKTLNEENWSSSEPVSPCMGWREGISFVLCCLSVITVLQAVSHPVSRNGWEANCFPLPPDDQAVCFLPHLHFFLFKP